jgi:hypothetical protein
MLTLKLENGEEKVIAMAVDGCCCWMSNGVYYRYTDGDLAVEMGDTVLYSLLLSEYVREQAQGTAESLEWIRNVNWFAYEATYGAQAARELMAVIEEQFLEYKEYYSVFFQCLNGLEGEYKILYGKALENLVQQDKNAFADAYFDSFLHDRIREIMSEYWDLTPEETDARFQEFLNAK